MQRPVVGIVGNQYLLNDQYPVHAGGSMNCEAITEVSGCMPMLIPADPRYVSVPELLDLSVNETLARTVMTSLTLLVALVPLLFFGPTSLFGLTAAITLGLFVGTYSSVYMASPLLIWMGVNSDSFVPEETVADKQERVARGEV